MEPDTQPAKRAKRQHDTEGEDRERSRIQNAHRHIELGQIASYGNFALYSRGPEIRALAMTSRSMQKGVEKVGPRQPYVKRCLLEQPPDSVPPLKFVQGCGHLFKNIIGLFSSVAVMANRVNLGATSGYNQVDFIRDRVGYIREIRFDIKEYKSANDDMVGARQTVFTNDFHQRLFWDTDRRKFFVRNDHREQEFYSEELFMRAISSHWSRLLPDSSYPYTDTSRPQNRFWAPTIEIEHTFKDAEMIMQIDSNMDLILRNTGTLAHAYSFIRTPRIPHLEYALVHHSIQQHWSRPASLWASVCNAFNAAIHPGDYDRWSHDLYVGGYAGYPDPNHCGFFSGFEGYAGYVAMDPGWMSLIDTSLRERKLMVVRGSTPYFDSKGMVRHKSAEQLQSISNALNDLGIDHTLQVDDTADTRGDYEFTLFPRSSD